GGRSVGVAETDLLEEGAGVGVRLLAERRQALPVAVHHLLRALVAAEGEVAVVVAVLGAEVPGLDRTEARDPDGGVRFLDGLRPEVDVAERGVLPVPGAGLGPGPGRH